jgi:hypothetical protein
MLKTMKRDVKEYILGINNIFRRVSAQMEKVYSITKKML